MLKARGLSCVIPPIHDHNGIGWRAGRHFDSVPAASSRTSRPFWGRKPIRKDRGAMPSSVARISPQPRASSPLPRRSFAPCARQRKMTRAARAVWYCDRWVPFFLNVASKKISGTFTANSRRKNGRRSRRNHAVAAAAEGFPPTKTSEPSGTGRATSGSANPHGRRALALRFRSLAARGPLDVAPSAPMYAKGCSRYYFGSGRASASIAGASVPASSRSSCASVSCRRSGSGCKRSRRPATSTLTRWSEVSLSRR